MDDLCESCCNCELKQEYNNGKERMDNYCNILHIWCPKRTYCESYENNEYYI